MKFVYRHTVLSLSAFLFSLTLFMLPAFADMQTGVIALYAAADPERFDEALDAFEVLAAEQSCNVRRAGEVLGAQGDLGIEQPNRMVHLTCDAAITVSSQGRSLLADLAEAGEIVGTVEGRFIIGPSDGSGSLERDYILKLSRYSNVDPDARDRDLAALGSLVGELADAYTNEVFLEVHRATGFATPDEAVLIYYTDVEAGARFRENNQAVLENIGLFNRDHLTAFVYFPIRSLR